MTAGPPGSASSPGSPPRSGRCLVLALDGIGDMVLRQPLLTGLADGGYEVHVLVQEGHERLLPFLDERLRGVPAPLEWTRPPAPDAVRRVLYRLRLLDPALVVSAQFDPVRYVDWILRSLRGAFTAGFVGGAWQEVTGARARETLLGLPEARALDLAVPCDESLGEADKGRRLLAALTGRTASPNPPRLVLRPRDRERAETVLASLGLESGRFVVCCPAGTKNVTIKAWPAERYGRIAAWAALEKGVPTLVMGHRSEAQVVDAVVDRARAHGGDVRSWRGGERDLETMVSLVALARLYLGNDTGAMHLAAAAGVPVAAVFGGGHWPRFLPVASRGAVHTRKLPCFGCGWRDCFFGDGPCVGEVREESVRASVARLLDGAGGFEMHEDALPLGEAEWGRAVEAFRALSHRADVLREERHQPVEGGKHGRGRWWGSFRAAAAAVRRLLRAVPRR